MNRNSILVERDNRVCTLTINRPELHNALTPEILIGIKNYLEEFSTDEYTRVVVIRGAGEAAFSAGYDIGQIPTFDELNRKDYHRETTVFIESCALIVIAMINGYCLGDGLSLAVSCDLRIASDTAKLGIPSAKLGVIYKHKGILSFINLIGVSHAKELFLSGRMIDARRAEQMGLVNHVVAAQDLHSVTYNLAWEIAENAPLAVRGTKKIFSKLLSYQKLPPEIEADLIADEKRAFDSSDTKEARRAFLEKRKPKFVGE